MAENKHAVESSVVIHKQLDMIAAQIDGITRRLDRAIDRRSVESRKALMQSIRLREQLEALNGRKEADKVTSRFREQQLVSLDDDTPMFEQSLEGQLYKLNSRLASMDTLIQELLNELQSLRMERHRLNRYRQVMCHDDSRAVSVDVNRP